MVHRLGSPKLGPGSEASRVGRPVPALGAEGRGPAQALLGLQRSAGNAAVATLLEDASATAGPPLSTEAYEHAFEVTIARPPVLERRSDRHVETVPKAPLRQGMDHDAEEDGVDSAEVNPQDVTAALQGSAAQVAEPEAGGSVTLADMAVPDAFEVQDHDAVKSTITFEPTVSQSGTVSPFGATSWSKFSVVSPVVTAAGGAFTVKFRLVNPITFNVTSPKTDIASEASAALTNANFAAAAADLKPRMSVQGGKPTRSAYWARDLTERHERFHSDERRRLNRAGAVQAEAWLSAQTAASVSDVQALIAQVPGRVIASSQAAVGTLDEKESRAYGDGASAYQARADAITAKGAKGPTAGGYP